MKRSPEKVLEFLEEMQSSTDQEIAEAIPLPVPPAATRAALAAVAAQVPNDADELDEWLGNLGAFCLALRSDPVDEPAPA